MSDEHYQIAADKFIFKVRKGLLYSENDVWAAIRNKNAHLGVTDFFQRQGGDVIFIELPMIGKRIELSEEIARLETIKSVLSVNSPLSGIVAATNKLLSGKPEAVNEDPYGEGWLVSISLSNFEGEVKHLLSADEYFKLLKKKIEDRLKSIKRE